MAEKIDSKVTYFLLGLGVGSLGPRDLPAGEIESQRRVNGNMATVCNLGRPDRMFRIVLGVGMGIADILVNGHPYFGRLLGIVGAVVILSAAWGT